VSTAKKSPWIVSARYDAAFFLAPPLAALLVGLFLGATGLGDDPIELGADVSTLSSFGIGVLIHAHLVAVFVRSHGNPSIFRAFPVRFLVVPIALFAAILASKWIAITAMVVATFWDVWHSGAQTFGFARIYDRNAGVPPKAGRRLDFALHQLLYAGPILAGATLLDHLIVLEEYEIFDGGLSDVLVLVPAEAQGHASTLTWIVLLAGVAFLALYVVHQRRLARRGHGASPQKVFLVASTALTSIVTWGFNPWGEAFLIMNAFHAVQYLALVWATEGERLTQRLRLARLPFGRSLALIAFLGSVLAYGCATELVDPEIEAFWAVTMVVSLMHFWYDAFVWSVRKNHV
jgi:hypothetical protein